MKKEITIVLVGNPNVGKTALVNSLAGSKLKIGNWPGVTVEKKEASFTQDGIRIRLIDLPGAYSLNTLTQDETITKNFLRAKDYDLILNVVDANNIETNLYLTSQLLEIGKPMTIAINFWDEFTRQGNKLDIHRLSRAAGVPVLPIEAIRNDSKPALIKTALQAVRSRMRPKRVTEQGKDRHGQIEVLLRDMLVVSPNSHNSFTDRADSLLLHPVTGLLSFFAIFYAIFKFTFDGSAPFVQWIDDFFNIFVRNRMGGLMDILNVPAVIRSFVIEGIVKGIGTVMTFIPLMAFLYFFIAILEESGYIARVAYLLDGYMRRIGLQGKAFIPLLVGLGCNVPGVYSTRTLEEDTDKKTIASVISFMSCGAKLPIYLLFAGVFFPRHAPLAAALLYLTGIIVALLWASILKKWVFVNKTDSLIIELPQFRMPTAGVLWNSVRLKIRSFVKRAGSVITAVVILIWALTNLPYGTSAENSVLSSAAKAVSPVFRPLGWGNSWRATASIIPGFLAKEAVIGALATTYNIPAPAPDTSGVVFISELVNQGVTLKDAVIESGTSIASGIVPGVFANGDPQNGALVSAIRKDFTPLAAASFLVFNLLLMSCTAVMGAIKQEFGMKFLLFTLVLTGSTAYVVSFAVYQLGILLGLA